jgi:SAM-dependent methyltransferase
MAYLSSPCCGTGMKFVSLENFPVVASVDVEAGTIACSACGREYPIIGGIPRLALWTDDSKVERTRESFASAWNRYPGSLPEDERVFLGETQLTPEEFRGKLVLDAGCGMGRYAVVALGLGAEVVALDLSGSLARLAAVAPQWPKLHVVEGDLLKVPLKTGIFDIVYSQGVLHHTPDTKAAFDQVARLVRPGGALTVWLYGRAGKYRDFATNPLRSDRAWVGRHRRLAWFIVGIRHLISDVVRMFTTRLPLRFVYALCYPLAFLGAIPLIKYFTFSVHPRFMVRVIENFDWISPPFQYHHTKEELRSWFEADGFWVDKVLPHGLVPKPGILGRRRTGRV